MNEMILAELKAMNEKLDTLVDNHGNRITKLEAEAGFIKAGFALLIATVMGACGWAFKKVFDHA